MQKDPVERIFLSLPKIIDQASPRVKLPLAAETKKDLPSLIRATDVPSVPGNVNFAPLFAGVAPAIPAKTFVPPVSSEPVRA